MHMTSRTGWAARVSAQAQSRPEARAVVLGHREMSYAELDRDSNRLAHALRDAGARPSDHVALVLDKSPEAVVAMLACLKGGFVYVAIDAASPVQQAQKIMDVCRPAVLLTHGAAASLATVLYPATGSRAWRTGWLDEVEPTGAFGSAEFSYADLRSAPDSTPTLPPGELRPAHALFDALSNAVVIGVTVDQSLALDFFDHTNAMLGVASGDKHSGLAPLHAGAATFDVFATLTAGAELHWALPEVESTATRLVTWIRQSELTQWSSPAWSLTGLLNSAALRYDDCLQLKRLLWTGELPSATHAALRRRLPHTVLTRLHGFAEVASESLATV